MKFKATLALLLASVLSVVGVSPAFALTTYSAIGYIGGWGPVSSASKSYWGTTSTTKVYYTWWVEGGSAACVQGMRYSPTQKGVRLWYGAGCGTSGSLTLTWGNMAGYPAMRVQSLNGYSIIRWHVGL